MIPHDIYILIKLPFIKHGLLSFVLLFISSFTYAQHKLTLEVKDDFGHPLMGANIIVKGTTTGTNTDANGFGQLDNLPQGTVIIEISFIGYEKQQIRVDFPDPDVPRILIYSFSLISKVAPLTAFTSSSPKKYDLLTF